jgi:hypothetical protein
MSTNIKQIVKIGSLFVFFSFIVVYAIFGSHDLIVGVKIKNVNIKDGSTMKDSALQITGNAKNGIFVTLNGREISVDQQGNFNETIALLPGYNIINIKARDKFGYIDEKNYKIMYQRDDFSF